MANMIPGNAECKECQDGYMNAGAFHYETYNSSKGPQSIRIEDQWLCSTCGGSGKVLVPGPQTSMTFGKVVLAVVVGVILAIMGWRFLKIQVNCYSNPSADYYAANCNDGSAPDPAN